MRRILATLVLAAFSLTLMPLALLAFADADSDLPACCRRDGMHKCSMSGMADDESGPSLRGVSRCPMYPKSSAAPAMAAIGAPLPLRDQSSSFASFLKRPEQAEARYRISFNRSRQKRGPPARFSPFT